MTISVKDKLQAIEAILDGVDWNAVAGDDRSTMHALRAIAADLRAELPDTAVEAQQALAQRIQNARKVKSSIGYEPGHLIGIAQELIGRWPIVEKALELYSTKLRGGDR